jgi:hypothetical protein
MTARDPRHTVADMAKRLRISRNLAVVLLTAVVSLTIAHLVDLGTMTFGSGPVSTWAIVGNLVGLATCAASAWFGTRRVFFSPTC